MHLGEPIHISTDVLVIGGGGAGLRAAIEARKSGAGVVVAAKHAVGRACNTSISSGGFAAAIGQPKDSPEAHLRDTLKSGCFINDRLLAEVLTQGSPRQVRDLADFGVAFQKDGGEVKLFQSPGHSNARSVRGARSFGEDFTMAMRDYAIRAGVTLAEGVCVTHLLKMDRAATGAVGIDREGNVPVFHARSVILATGGAGQTYLNTDNAGGMTGDGYALAYNIGLTLRDMEFVQFYPTGFGRLGRSIVIYEALVARLGATLRNSLGEDIREKYGLKDPLTMTRDRLSRAIFREIMEGRATDGGVIIDLSTIPPEGMKNARTQMSPWMQIDKQSFIVAPTCHFFMGGIKTNERGETGLEGLWAAGEVCSGVHGANRLAGNAIAEIFVFGAITGREAGLWVAKTAADPKAPGDLSEALADLNTLAANRGGEQEGELREQLRQTMWLRAGIIRDEKRLKETLAQIASLRERLHRCTVAMSRDLVRLAELRNMLLVSEMVCRAALVRQESRGSHFRSDYPEQNDADWLKNIAITREGEKMALDVQPVGLDKLSRQ